MSESRLPVPVATPETADRLLDTAVSLARDRDLEVLVLHVIALAAGTSSSGVTSTKSSPRPGVTSS